MKKRVQISYTVEMDGIPSEIDRLIHTAVDSIDVIPEQLEVVQEKILLDKNYMIAAEKVDEIRTSLAEVDQRLGDCYNLLIGYQRAILDERNENQLNLDLGGEKNDPS